MQVGLSVVQFVESGLYLVQQVADATRVGQRQQAVLVAGGGRVADADLERVLVPSEHLEVALDPSYVPCDVGDGRIAADDERGGHAGGGLRVYVDELVGRGQHVAEQLIEPPWQHGFVVDLLGVSSCGGRVAVDRTHRRQQEMQTGIRHQVGSDFVEVDVERALKAHRTGEVEQQVGNDAIHFAEGVLVCLAPPAVPRPARRPDADTLPWRHRLRRQHPTQLLRNLRLCCHCVGHFDEGVVGYGQHTRGMLLQHTQRQRTVVGRCDDVVIL
mmetsp:Transcript_18653/g.53418  ORF Transcript_18653/g.53418 Transcript_18653/m.53418 type:complete len:271 (+) Transcript_18653:822-1634(+)